MVPRSVKMETDDGRQMDSERGVKSIMMLYDGDGVQEQYLGDVQVDEGKAEEL